MATIGLCGRLRTYKRYLYESVRKLYMNEIGSISEQGSFMAAMIRASEGILKHSMMMSLVMGLALILGGIVLVYLGNTGDTEFTLFGNQFKSTSVGVVGIFCGAVVVVLGQRRSLKSLDGIRESGHDAG